MENDMLDLGFWQLVAAYLFIILLLIIVKLRKIPREKEIFIATLRMTLQLLLVGYVLMYIFEQPHPLITIGIILFMVTFAIFNIYKRVDMEVPRRLKKMVAFSMIIGTIASTLYFNLVVIQFNPWYDPRYFIPIAGMIIGNSMTGISLGVQTLVEQMKSKKQHIEAALMLGATPKEATRKIVNHSFDSAILPTINSMVGIGIVFLPGMMTGQILAGASPVIAIKYQIAIMLGITGSVAFTVIIFVQQGYKIYFNKEKQLVEES